MRVSAGKVAIRPRGDYDAEEGYRRLDLVRYKNGAYVCRKSCIGELPTNEEFWMTLFIEENRVEVDSELSETSTNPVQNDVVTQAMKDIQKVIENLPKDEPIAIDEVMNAESKNPVQNKVVFAAIKNIKDIVENLHIGSGGEVDLGGYATDVDNLKKSIEAIDTNLEDINADLELCKGKVITTKYQNGKLYGRTDENGEWIEIVVDSGKDIVVPTIEVSGNTLIVTDKDGVHSYDLPGGGATEGAAGFSPTVAIDGNKITVVDKEGSHEYEISHIDEDARNRLDKLETLLANAEIMNKQPVGTDKNAKLGPATEQGIKSEGGYVYVNWKDPDDVIVDGEVTARWAGTKIVRKEGSAPESVEDGAVDNHTYRMNGAEPCKYVLSTGIHYYFAIYPYTVSSVYSDPVVVDIDLTTAVIPKPEVIEDGKAVKVNATSCKIKFTKGANTESVALMHRKGETPKSLVQDGTTVIRGITSGTVVKGLDDASTYYFKLVSIGTDGTKVKGDTFTYQTEVEIVSFADGTWKQIGKMLDAHYAGIIDIADYWKVGDERVINVDDIEQATTKCTSPSYGGEKVTFSPMSGGQYTIVIMDIKYHPLTNNIGTKNVAAVSIGFKNCLQHLFEFKYHYHHSNVVNYGWAINGTARSWFNSFFIKALPTVLQSLIKSVKRPDTNCYNSNKYSSLYQRKSNVFNTDKIFIVSGEEIGIADVCLNCNYSNGSAKASGYYADTITVDGLSSFYIPDEKMNDQKRCLAYYSQPEKRKKSLGDSTTLVCYRIEDWFQPLNFCGYDSVRKCVRNMPFTGEKPAYVSPMFCI